MKSDSILGGIAAKIGGGSRASGFETQDMPGMLNSLFNLDGDHGNALTTVVKKTLIGSNVYIEDALNKEDDTMVPLMSVLCQVYVGYILTALQIYQSVDRYRTISETIGRVATESLEVPGLEDVDPQAILRAAFGDEEVAAGLEAARDSKMRNDIDEAVKHLAAGRLIEFDFHVARGENAGEVNPTGVEHKGSGIVTVPMYVQLYPTAMPSEVAKALVQFNYPERFWRRLAKAMSREIRFFRDFVLAMDLVERHNQILKQDRNNVLSDFYKDKITKQSKRVMDVLTGRNRNNIANSMLVISADTFKQINDESSIDLRNYADRQRFFNEAYAMILVVVDTNYNIIEMYYNGIPKKSEMPFRAVKQAGSTKSGIDIEELMQTIAKGAAPKF